MKLLITLLIITLLACGTGPTITGTETTNGPAAGIITISSEPGVIRGETDPGSAVTCVSSNYIPLYGDGFDTSLTVKSDGEFTLHLDEGVYSITAVSGEKRVIVQNITVPGAEAPSVEPISREYRETATISGTVRKFGEIYTNGLLYIAGTTLYGLTSESGTFQIEGVPIDTGYTLIMTEQIPTDGKSPVDTIPLGEYTDGSWSSLELDL